MSRTCLYLHFRLETADRLLHADGGGIELLGIYLALATYQDGRSAERGRLIFRTIESAAQTLRLSRNTLRKYMNLLIGMGLMEVSEEFEGGLTHKRMRLVEAPAIRHTDQILNSDGQNLTGTSQSLTSYAQDLRAVTNVPKEKERSNPHPEGEHPRVPEQINAEKIGQDIGVLIDKVGHKFRDQITESQQGVLVDLARRGDERMVMAAIRGVANGLEPVKSWGLVITLLREFSAYAPDIDEGMPELTPRVAAKLAEKVGRLGRHGVQLLRHAVTWMVEQQEPTWGGVQELLFRWEGDQITNVTAAVALHKARKAQRPAGRQSPQERLTTERDYRSTCLMAFRQGKTLADVIRSSRHVDSALCVETLTKARRIQIAEEVWAEFTKPVRITAHPPIGRALNGENRQFRAG